MWKDFSALEFYGKAKPYLIVILLQFGYAGIGIIAKFGLDHGMNHYTFAVYRAVVASLVFAPFALVLDRKVRPRMTISIFLKIVILGLLEPVIDQNLYYAGMKYTTATFATAMTNILPAITFLLAWIFRLEKVNIRRLHSQAKMVGTLVTLGGAMIMTLMNGARIGLPWTKEKSYAQSTSAAANDQQDPIKGALMITAACFGWASFYILQAFTLKEYPAELSLTTLICMMGALQGSILTLIMEKGNKAIWSLRWDSQLLSALYGGIICTGGGYYIAGLLMKERGPVFVTAFNPLSMILVAIMGSFILAEQMYMGRVIGAIVIVIGLYLVIWGKRKDENPSSKSDSDGVVPLPLSLPVDQQAQNNTQTTKTSIHESVKGDRVVPNDEAV